MIDQATIFGLNQPRFVAFVLYKYLIFAAQIGYFNQTLVQCTFTKYSIYITLRFAFSGLVWFGLVGYLPSGKFMHKHMNSCSSEHTASVLAFGVGTSTMAKCFGK